jgi:hypothetical protein
VWNNPIVSSIGRHYRLHYASQVIAAASECSKIHITSLKVAVDPNTQPPTVTPLQPHYSLNEFRRQQSLRLLFLNIMQLAVLAVERTGSEAEHVLGFMELTIQIESEKDLFVFEMSLISIRAHCYIHENALYMQDTKHVNHQSYLLTPT